MSQKQFVEYEGSPKHMRTSSAGGPIRRNLNKVFEKTGQSMISNKNYIKGLEILIEEEKKRRH